MSSPVAGSTNVALSGSRRWWIASFCLLCGLAIVLLSWASRYSMNPDGISYLDMADLLLKGNLGVLLHPYWSPLYPAILAVALKIFSPTPSSEVLVVHFVNCVVGLIALSTFTFFLTQWSRHRAADKHPQIATPQFRVETAFAYLLFLWCTAELSGLGPVTPDLCVAAIVFLVAGLCCRLTSAEAGWPTAIALGLALSFGYFGKAAMLPLGVALLVILFIPRLFAVPRRSLVALSAGVFFLAIAPHIFLLSRQAHHFSFGDSGRLNYAWLVLEEVPAHQGWTQYTPQTGTPVHPLRVLRVDPTVLEFDHTVPGTYPLWYNPAYFYDGLRTHFDMRKQRIALLHSAQSFFVSLGKKQLLLLAGFIALCVFTIWRRAPLDLSRSWLVLWSLSAFGMYALVGIEPRYIASFIALFWIALYEAVSPDTLPSLRLPRLAILSAAVTCILISESLFLWSAVSNSLHDSSAANQIAIATELSRMGLRKGDEIATVGEGTDAYYARLAQLQVVETIAFRGKENDLAEFWALSDENFATLKDELRRTGARAIVTHDAKCEIVPQAGWHGIKGTGFCVQMLD